MFGFVYISVFECFIELIFATFFWAIPKFIQKGSYSVYINCHHSSKEGFGSSNESQKSAWALLQQCLHRNTQDKAHKKGMLFEKKSVQQINKYWRHTLFSKNAIKVGSLFKIAKDTNLLTGNEKAFCEDKDMLENAGSVKR